MYSPEEYFKKLYPEWFHVTTLSEILFYVFLFFLLMLAFYFYIKYFEGKKRIKMPINDNKYEIGDEIDCGMYGKLYDKYRIIIRKVRDSEWVIYRLTFNTEDNVEKEVPLMRGDLRKIMDYMNRNFWYDNDAV